MIIYLHGFDSSSPGNHEKVLQLKFIDDDVRFINYSTLHPRHDMQFLLKKVHITRCNVYDIRHIGLAFVTTLKLFQFSRHLIVSPFVLRG